ncbi:hypothetical protein G5714_002603 [Onychostoma macrolepis]|uniref:Uncharacterized protein n=1 Tax=Onychostoma macrolepis TaxID=369639 RepID=A0A7J6D884_9TELE|nr:hypothetical protein G5714_002603 [Onychostoma macrolepis]
MKKLLLLWTRGRTDFRMLSGDVTHVSGRLETLKKSIPDCFARKPGSLQEIDRWKATEFRQFAIYTGKIVLKGILQEQLYEHFLSFSTALCILVYLRYVVLNFIEQNEVEVAPSSWLERIDGVLFCYWPNSNVGTKVIKCAIPDKHLWTKYVVRVYSDTDSYKLARYRAQKAVETSHVEDSDGNSSRKIIPPRRFRAGEPNEVPSLSTTQQQPHQSVSAN